MVKALKQDELEIQYKDSSKYKTIILYMEIYEKYLSDLENNKFNLDDFLLRNKISRAKFYRIKKSEGQYNGKGQGRQIMSDDQGTHFSLQSNLLINQDEGKSPKDQRKLLTQEYRSLKKGETCNISSKMKRIISHATFEYKVFPHIQNMVADRLKQRSSPVEVYGDPKDFELTSKHKTSPSEPQDSHNSIQENFNPDCEIEKEEITNPDEYLSYFASDLE